MMRSAKDIGTKLRELRGERSRRSVAKEMGLSETALGNYENGIRVPNDEAKEIIARYYGRTVDDLFYT